MPDRKAQRDRVTEAHLASLTASGFVFGYARQDAKARRDRWICKNEFFVFLQPSA